uniref:Otospiralin n=1 Tax=Erpetoichthys calabaricus TaxID=27687 RepID=A0A8C4S2V5_ERPCA
MSGLTQSPFIAPDLEVVPGQTPKSLSLPGQGKQSFFSPGARRFFLSRGDDALPGYRACKGPLAPLQRLLASPALPYWSYSTNDFWRYIEYFRSIGAYHHINNMARTFFAHQPLGDTLGYEVPVADEEH